MRKDSIGELLMEVKEIVEIISSHKKISRPKVKSVLEHLRSCLEYSAQDISCTLTEPKEKIYFPYANNYVDFEKSIKRNLPKLDSAFPKIYEQILLIQNFKSGDDWLIKLCNLTNKAKHNDAITIHGDEEIVKSIYIGAKGFNLARLDGNCSNIRFTNNRVNGVLIDDFIFDKGKIEITKHGDAPINFRITKDRKIIVGDEKIDLLPFLQSCIKNTEEFITRLYTILEN